MILVQNYVKKSDITRAMGSEDKNIRVASYCVEVLDNGYMVTSTYTGHSETVDNKTFHSKYEAM